MEFRYEKPIGNGLCPCESPIEEVRVSHPKCSWCSKLILVDVMVFGHRGESGSVGDESLDKMDDRRALASRASTATHRLMSLFSKDPESSTKVVKKEGGSWTSLLCYSLLFSLLLTLYWGCCLWSFYQTLDNYAPSLQQSLIGSHPGLGFRPLLESSDPYSSLIWFRHGARGDWKSLREELDRFLNAYEPGYWANAGASQTKCHWDRGPLNTEEACEFNKEWLSDPRSDIKCISEESYGYYYGKPCLLLKLNRIYGWRPQAYFNLTEVDNVQDMPSTLKSTIRQVWNENCRGRGLQTELECPELNMVWLHCDGELAADKENIGNVSYTPWQGFPTYFFPYYNQLGYLAPVVMVQLKNPTPGVLINIRCTAWAKNLRRSAHLTQGQGSVHIELLMD